MQAHVGKPRVLRVLFALVGLAAAMLLVGCGAVLDTAMVINRDGSGTRTMTLTLPASDAAKLVGGAEGADASIRAHLPESMDYSGITTLDDGSLMLTLTLAFVDSDEYKEVVYGLLGSRDGSTASIGFDVADSTLVSGVTIAENFTSQALLSWLFDGLVEDGVVDPSNRNNMSEVGTTALTFDGVGIDVSSGSIVGTAVDDNGFDAVTMATDISEFELIRRTITFVGADGVDERLYDDYFTAHTPEAATLRRVSDTWELSFAGEADEIADSTGIAMDADESIFALDTRISSAAPASLDVSLTNVVGCENVCSVEAPPLTDDVTASADVSPANLSMRPDSGEIAELSYTPSFTSASQEVTVGLFGDVSARTTFRVPSQAAALVGKGFEEMLAPDANVGTINVSEAGGEATYVVDITGETLDEFNSAYSAWASSGGITVVPSGGENIFWSSRSYTFNPSLAAVTGAHAVEEPGTVQLSLPLGSWLAGGSADAPFGGVVEVRAAGLSPAGMGGMAALLLALGVSVFLLVNNRERLIARHSRPAVSAVAWQPSAMPAAVPGSGLFTVRYSAPIRPGGSLFTLPQAHVSIASGALLGFRTQPQSPGERPRLTDLNVPRRTVRGTRLINFVISE
ncbi:hypothetical protein [Microbacterium sp. SA39]|uniref:hypothetical protein n=1 Tax=Microbacterium sp. SA39 TaxID=1263625 RepID=UPI0005F9B5D3|nr:hypothetical protein [Microbacterium sp. SA39]KJQ53708.1 hypothetical protein RS85_02258 [Microbacterium sp. SA39]